MKLPRSCAELALISISSFVFFPLWADDAVPERKQPVNVCIVSGEHLQPGDIVTYVYQEEGKPDRTIRLCCRKCLARFKANPDIYLKKLDRLESAQKEKTEQ